jgi:hypothetical protein
MMRESRGGVYHRDSGSRTYAFSWKNTGIHAAWWPTVRRLRGDELVDDGQAAGRLVFVVGNEGRASNRIAGYGAK